MSTITSVKLWNDIGYTEGATEIPPVGHVLGTPDIEIAGPINPSKGRLFAEFQVKEPYTDLMACSYLEVEIAFNNGLTSKTFFGWVDDVVLSSDTDDYPMTIVQWHVDLWRTYNSGAEYGSGMVRRRPHTDTDFYQNYPHRYLQKDTVIPIHTGDTAFVIVAYNKKLASMKAIVYAVFFISTNPSETIHYAGRISPGGETDYYSLNITDFRTGIFDEAMEIDPDNIMSVTMSPVNPLGVTFRTVAGITDVPELEYHAEDYNTNPLVNPRGKNVSIVGQNKKILWFETMVASWHCTGPSGPVDVFPEYSLTLPQQFTVTEEHPVFIMGFNGEKVGELPFGLTTNQIIKLRVIVTPVSSTLELRFSGTDASCNLVGMTIDIPLPSLDSNSNAWSSYVYSGQRDHDITTRNNATITGMVTGALSSGVMGSALNSMSATAKFNNETRQITKGTRANMSAIKGGIAFAGASLAGGLVELGTNAMVQAAEDQLHANQPSQILTSGSAIDVLFHGVAPSIVTMKFDDESQAILEADRAVVGVSFGQNVEDCTALITTGGPLQIDNLIVKGDIPVAAKKWIREKMADGVRIVTR